MARRTYTDQDKARVAVALAANDGNVKRTARECDVPVQTVRDWKKLWEREGFPASVEEEIPAAAEEFTEVALRVRSKAMDKLEQAVDNDELKPKELMVAIGILTDKVQAIKNAGKGGSKGDTININLPAPSEFRQAIEEYVDMTVQNAKDRDNIIVEATDAEWEQVEKKALPSPKGETV